MEVLKISDKARWLEILLDIFCSSRSLPICACRINLSPQRLDSGLTLSWKVCFFGGNFDSSGEFPSQIKFFLVMPSVVLSIMKCIIFTSVNFCYPNSTRGLVLATPDLVSLALFWTSSYIITAVQKDNNLDVYFYSQIGIVWSAKSQTWELVARHSPSSYITVCSAYSDADSIYEGF